MMGYEKLTMHVLALVVQVMNYEKFIMWEC